LFLASDFRRFHILQKIKIQLCHSGLSGIILYYLSGKDSGQAGMTTSQYLIVFLPDTIDILFLI